MKLRIFLPVMIIIIVFYSCKKYETGTPVVKYPSDVANAWMQMQIRLTRSTTGYNSVVSDRSFAYAGITMYEALVPGLPGYRSLLSQIGGTAIPLPKNRSEYYWPASVNAAMAMITRSFFVTTSPANLASIDSLESAYAAGFLTASDADKIQNAVDYGHQVATSVFEWSKTDGGHEAYSHIVDPSYIAPVGAGLWVPTFPAFGPPVHPHWGDNRSFISSIATATQPGPPIAYSEIPNSPLPIFFDT